MSPRPKPRRRSSPSTSSSNTANFWHFDDGRWRRLDVRPPFTGPEPQTEAEPDQAIFDAKPSRSHCEVVRSTNAPRSYIGN